MERHRYLPLLIAIASLWVDSPTSACNVPVFRYALERWMPDIYEAILFHEGPLTPDLEQLVRVLRQTGEHGRSVANLRLTTVDLRGDGDDVARDVWKSQDGATAPWLVVRYPKSLMVDNPLWAGQTDRATAELLLQSPARIELARRLLAGQSTVWILIESGDAEQDRKLRDSLGRELKRLEKSIKLPDESAQPGGVLKLPADQPGEGVLSKVPLKIEFSVLPIARSDPSEQAFLASILQTDEELAANSGAIVVPVFGRGRALQAFPGAGLDADTIGGAEEFLCGACSCSVKTQNPGMDLLISADWETALGVELAGAVEAVENEPITATLVPIPAGQQSPDIVAPDIVAPDIVAPDIVAPDKAGPDTAAPVNVAAKTAELLPSANGGRQVSTLLLSAVTIAGVLVAVASALALRAKQQSSKS